MVYQVTVDALGGATLFAFDHDPTHHAAHGASGALTLAWNARDLLAFPANQQ